MPLVRINLMDGKPESYRLSICNAVHRAMVETIGVPDHDRFQILTEHTRANFLFQHHSENFERTDAFVVIQITLNAGRTTEMKNSFYQRVAELLSSEVGVRKEDIFVSLVEVASENWFVL